MEYTNLERVLNDFCNEFVEVLRAKLLADGRKASGDLINSLKTQIRYSHNELAVILNSEDYLKYVDDGRKSGKWPPTEPIEKWVNDKGIQPYPDSNGKLPTEKQLVYLIRRAIGENGTIKDLGYTGGNYTESTVRELYQKYRGLFEAALMQDFNEYSLVILDEIDKMIRI